MKLPREQVFHKSSKNVVDFFNTAETSKENKNTALPLYEQFQSRIKKKNITELKRESIF